MSIRVLQLKKYPKIYCGAGILPAHNTRTGKMPIPQDWVIFFVEFSKSLKMVSVVKLRNAGLGLNE
jgi:hypothetical protein